MEAPIKPVEISVDTTEVGAETIIDTRVREAAEAAIKATDESSEVKPIDWEKTEAAMVVHSND